MPVRAEHANEGLIISTTVHCVGKGFNINQTGKTFSGSLRVASKYKYNSSNGNIYRTRIIDLNYLWGKLRDQGGAYGAFVVHFEL